MSKNTIIAITATIAGIILVAGGYKAYMQHQENKQLQMEKAQVEAMLDWNKKG